MAMIAVAAVFDLAVHSYMKPMFVSHTGAAVRAFGDEVNKKDDNPLAKHPEDYELHHLALWDEENGTFEPVSDKVTYVVLVRGKDCKSE